MNSVPRDPLEPAARVPTQVSTNPLLPPTQVMSPGVTNNPPAASNVVPQNIPTNSRQLRQREGERSVDTQRWFEIKDLLSPLCKSQNRSGVPAHAGGIGHCLPLSLSHLKLVEIF